MGANSVYHRSLTGRLRLMLTVLLILLISSPLVLAETLEQRLHRLEAEVQELRSSLSQQKQGKASPKKPAAVSKTVASVSLPLQSSAYVRYYIQSQPLGRWPPDKASALASGRFSVPDELSFDPAAYDVANANLFSAYRDPAEYAYAGLEMRADLNIVKEGEYEFVIYPRPARDGGTNVVTRLSLFLSLGKQQIVSLQNDSSWHPQRSRISLSPGHYRLHLWAVASSDGFGPTPTDSRLRLLLKGPGDVSPRPLYGLQAPAVPDKD